MTAYNRGYSLAELLDDPVTRLVMQSDRVDRECLERMLARLGLGRGPAEAQPVGFGVPEEVP